MAMAIQEHEIIFPKHMRWARRCQFLLANLLFSTSTLYELYMHYHVRAGGTMVHKSGRLVFNEQCLCIHSIKRPCLPLSPLSPHTSIPHLLLLQHFVR